MNISTNKFVSVTYDLNVGDGDERELMERATAQRPLEFIFGTGAMLPAFEEELNGLTEGAEFIFTLTPDKAYGEYEAENLIELPKTMFEVDGQFDDENVIEGSTIPMIDSNGQRLMGSVHEIREDVVIMDFNHPLAGETLHFSGKVIDVHEPTSADMAKFNGDMHDGCGSGGCEGCGGGCG
ncbi:MAG: FKBP-type peptidyl-prolyl cis-trans isomerase [Tannerella sp.]|jgi:FKBP-type peptidyl-prolyl cis-trans isomerase SlyD|nr:FKBP-type peptidyl-prolyl cis-trans isomerase [Tannerella sp.]